MANGVSKLTTYSTISDTFCVQPYHSKWLIVEVGWCFAQIRTGSHQLQVEQGRRTGTIATTIAFSLRLPCCNAISRI